MGPLKGLRVLDFSRVLAGPWAAQMLADLGAEVIKVERTGSGDDTRHWGPPYLKDRAGQPTAESAYFLSTNRGKRSVALDLSRPEGQRLARELATGSDVLIENFKVGGAARLGIGWPEMHQQNPRLVYCSISAFGQDGPLAAEPGYDAMVQAMGGLMSITGIPEGLPGAGPQKVGVAVVDLMTGMYAVSAITAALMERSSSGLGQHIDLSLLDTQVSWLANQSMNYLVGGEVPARYGTAHANIVPYQAFASRDGWLMLAVGNDRQFRRFCQAAGAPELGDDERYASNASRVRNRAGLIAALEPIMAARNSQEWFEVLAAAEVPCGPINSIPESFDEPQVRHRAMRFDLPHPLAGAVPMIANPIRYSRSGVEYHHPPPMLGQHTDEVLGQYLGLDAAALAALRADGVIG